MLLNVLWFYESNHKWTSDIRNIKKYRYQSLIETITGSSSEDEKVSGSIIYCSIVTSTAPNNPNSIVSQWQPTVYRVNFGTRYGRHSSNEFAHSCSSFTIPHWQSQKAAKNKRRVEIHVFKVEPMMQAHNKYNNYLNRMSPIVSNGNSYSV